jgi:hypothetical protein
MNPEFTLARRVMDAVPVAVRVAVAGTGSIRWAGAPR